MLKDKNITIIGMGLLGTSLAMALRGKCAKITGWSRSADSRSHAMNVGALDCTAETPQEAMAMADVVVICLPIPRIIDFLYEYADNIPATAAVTDIGSVKHIITVAGEKTVGGRFIGSHPMAGTEKSGGKAAFATLYAHAEVFVTPTQSTDRDALNTVVAMWESIGTSVKQMPPTEHDELVAHTSHISHLLALGLTLSVLDESDPARKGDRFSGCATGFRDTSRIVSSMPSMWREIIEANRPAVLGAMDEFQSHFSYIRQLIEEGRFDEFEELFAQGKSLRDSWIDYKNREHGCDW